MIRDLYAPILCECNERFHSGCVHKWQIALPTCFPPFSIIHIVGMSPGSLEILRFERSDASEMRNGECSNCHIYCIEIALIKLIASLQFPYLLPFPLPLPLPLPHRSSGVQPVPSRVPSFCSLRRSWLPWATS